MTPQLQGCFHSLCCTFQLPRHGVCAGADEPVAESPYYLRVLPGEPLLRRSAVMGDGRSSAAVGREAEFWVAAKDQFGNRHVSGSD